MRTVLLISLVFIVFSEVNGQGCTSEIEFDVVKNRSDRADFTALPPSNSLVGHGSMLSCACETEVKKKRYVFWTDPNELKLKPDTRPASRDFSRKGNVSATVLNIRDSFNCNHAGVYTCNIGNSSSRVLVTPIDVDCSPMNVSITAVPSGPVATGTEIAFTCLAVNPTNTSLRYSWSANGEELLGENGTSVVVPIKENTSITCSVSNDVGNSSATTSITVTESVEPTPSAFLLLTSQTAPSSDTGQSSPTTSDTSSVSVEYTAVKTTVIESSKLVASSAQAPSDVATTSRDTNPQSSVSEGTTMPGDSPSVSMETSIRIQYTKAIMETAVSTSTFVPSTSLLVHIPSLLMSSSLTALSTSPPSISSSLTLVSTPSPSVSTPSPSVSTPSPLVSTPSPLVSTPSPSVPTPSPSDSTPSPSVPTPSPSVSTPSPSVSTPLPSVSTPSPSVPTPSPSVPTPLPSVSTPSPSVPTPSPVPTPSSSVPTPSPSSPPPPVVQKPNSSFDGDEVSIGVTWSAVDGAEDITVWYTWTSLWTIRSRRQEPNSEEVTLGPQNTSYTVEDAEGYSEYCFTITANYANGVSSPAGEQCVDTPTTKPSAPVSVEFPDTRSTSFVVKWGLPERPNGEITWFKVSYNKTDATQRRNVTYDAYRSNGYQVTIEGLSPETRYLIGVAAVNDAGEGPMTTPDAIFTKAGKPLIDTNVIIAIVVACLVAILLLLICIVALCIIVLKCKTKKARRTFDAHWWVEPTDKEERVGLEELESQRNGKSDSSQNVEAGRGSTEDIEQPAATTTSFFVQMKNQPSSP